MLLDGQFRIVIVSAEDPVLISRRLRALALHERLTVPLEAHILFVHAFVTLTIHRLGYRVVRRMTRKASRRSDLIHIARSPVYIWGQQ